MHAVLRFSDSFHMWSDMLLVLMVKKCQAATVGLFCHNLGFISEFVSVYFPLGLFYDGDGIHGSRKQTALRCQQLSTTCSTFHKELQKLTVDQQLLPVLQTTAVFLFMFLSFYLLIQLQAHVGSTLKE